MIHTGPASVAVPRFSIVTAVHNVARYLDAFIASIDGQTLRGNEYEVIAVDDGSTDESLQILQVWAARRPDVVRVFTKENGGQGSARNLGLDMARGEWVTFTDPDDMLAPQYLESVERFLRQHPTTVMVGTSRILLDDATGETSKHPLQWQFAQNDRLLDLSYEWEHFYASAPCAFFLRQRIEEARLRFDPRIRPHFEDGYFCCEYLLKAELPLVGFVSSAQYIYRRRQDQSSTLQKSLSDAGRYTTVMRRGYLAILEAAVHEKGSIPEWLQNLIIYELSWYFSGQDNAAGAMGATRGPVSEEFHRLLAEITSLLDDRVVEGFRIRPLARRWREVLLHAYKPDAWHSPFVLLVKHDPDQRLVKLTYDYMGTRPVEEFLSGGSPVVPTYEKVRAISYHNRTLLFERIVWLPLSTLRVKLNGEVQDLRFSDVEPPVHVRRAAYIASRLSEASSSSNSVQQPSPHVSLRTKLTARLATIAPVRWLYGNSWVLMDRIHDANDSAEQLFTYLRRERRDVNAWFVVERDTPDWRRMRSEGHDRLVPHGSLQWKLLMANCRHLVSSHADLPVMRPPAIMQFHEPSWRFTFLQHGVIKDDLSQWLNPKDISVFVTSTRAEYESIVESGTSYSFTNKEVKLTGLPRFDRLRAKGAAIPPRERDLLLVAPTWRNWLFPPLRSGSQRRALSVDGFLASDYAAQWLGLLRSADLAELAEAYGLAVGFLPHPNLQSLLGQFDLPDHVRPLTYTETDVQELFARAAVFVTDYSSIAFNAAYIERPVVYFQFDAARMQEGGHVGRQGYFDYERDGFGPVAVDIPSALNGIAHALKHGPSPEEHFQERIRAAFPLRDGRCSERVVAEIEKSAGPPWSSTPAAAPAAPVARLRRALRRRLGSRARGWVNRLLL